MLSDIPLSLPPVISGREKRSLDGIDLRNFLIKRFPRENKLRNLLKVALAATEMSPPRYLTSIFGPPWSWVPPHDDFSEFTALNPWRPVETAELLWKLTIPAFDHAPDKWIRTFTPPIFHGTFWRPSDYYRRPDPSADVSSHPSERWFFINGICTHQPMAWMNTDLMNRIFRRPATLIHNQTSSFLFDLAQCAVGKTFKTNPNLSERQTMTTPCLKAATAILDSLHDRHVERVIVIAHSQGTIIAANVVRAIHEAILTLNYLRRPPTSEETDNMDDLASEAITSLSWSDTGSYDEELMKQKLIAMLQKLEIYLFANCADRLTYPIVAKNENNEEVGLPYIESFANENDLVARLGILSPLREPPASDPEATPLIELDGPAFVQKGENSWGHLLNEHYLFPMERFLKSPHDTENPFIPLTEDQPAFPRLYGYFYGHRPIPYFSGARRESGRGESKGEASKGKPSRKSPEKRRESALAE